MSKGSDQEKTNKKSKGYRVFISYSSEDSSIARSVAKNCEKLGLHAWLDEENIMPGMNWRDEIEAAIKSSEVAIVIISKNSISPNHANKDWSLICEEKWQRPDIKIVSLKIEKIKTPPFLCKYKSFYENKKKSDYDPLLNFLKNITTSKDTEVEIFSYGPDYETNLQEGKKRFRILEKSLKKLVKLKDEEGKIGE